jgi:hypothetical protein
MNHVLNTAIALQVFQHGRFLPRITEYERFRGLLRVFTVVKPVSTIVGGRRERTGDLVRG